MLFHKVCKVCKVCKVHKVHKVCKDERYKIKVQSQKYKDESTKKTVKS